ncbi:MAG: hypothetical protein LBV69_09975, partial [Bacteroidales bacterium]|nr:hypothetical protein [Bacteroidales bacterium]
MKNFYKELGSCRSKIQTNMKLDLLNSDSINGTKNLCSENKIGKITNLRKLNKWFFRLILIFTIVSGLFYSNASHSQTFYQNPEIIVLNGDTVAFMFSYTQADEDCKPEQFTITLPSPISEWEITKFTVSTTSFANNELDPGAGDLQSNGSMLYNLHDMVDAMPNSNNFMYKCV